MADLLIQMGPADRPSQMTAAADDSGLSQRRRRRQSSMAVYQNGGGQEQMATTPNKDGIRPWWRTSMAAAKIPAVALDTGTVGTGTGHTYE